MYVLYMSTHMYVEVMRQFARVNLSFYHVVLKNQVLVVKVASEFLFLTSHLASPQKHFHFIFCRSPLISSG